MRNSKHRGSKRGFHGAKNKNRGPSGRPMDLTSIRRRAASDWYQQFRSSELDDDVRAFATSKTLAKQLDNERSSSGYAEPIR